MKFILQFLLGIGILWNISVWSNVGIPIDQQRLFIQLEDGRRLYDYNIPNGSTIGMLTQPAAEDGRRLLLVMVPQPAAEDGLRLSLGMVPQPAAEDGLRLSLGMVPQPAAEDGRRVSLGMVPQPAAEDGLRLSLGMVPQPAAEDGLRLSLGMVPQPAAEDGLRLSLGMVPQPAAEDGLRLSLGMVPQPAAEDGLRLSLGMVPQPAAEDGRRLSLGMVPQPAAEDGRRLSLGMVTHPAAEDGRRLSLGMVTHPAAEYDKEGIPISAQRLFFKGIRLREDLTMADYDIRWNDSIIYMIPQPLMPSEEMQILVKNKANDKMIGLKVKCTDTVLNVQWMIKAIEGIPVSKQALSFKTKRFETNRFETKRLIYPHQTLAQYNIRENWSIIEMEVKHAGYSYEVPMVIMNNKKIKLEVYGWNTIHNVMKKIQEKEDIPLIEQQLLLYDGSPVKDDITLAGYIIENNWNGYFRLLLHQPPITYEIMVRTSGGKMMKLEVHDWNTVRNVMKKIQEKEGIPISAHLFFNGIQLKEYLTMADYDIRKESLGRVLDLTMVYGLFVAILGDRTDPQTELLAQPWHHCCKVCAEEAGHVQRAKHFVHNDVIPSASHFDSTGEFPWPWVRRAHALGLMNTGMPAENGGIGLPLKAKIGIFESIAYGDIGLGTTLMVSELSQQPLLYAGTSEQKQKYLGPMLEQPLLAAFAVTEPDAGSDVSNVGSPTAVSQTAPDPDAPAKDAFTGFIVERNTPGLSVGEKERNMGQRCCDNRMLFLENVKVPVANAVGRIGGGFRLTMRAFDRTRPVVASMACGLQQRALDEATKYAMERRTFGKPIIEYQGVSFKLAEMAMHLEASKGIVKQAAKKVDAQAEDAVYFASMAKCFACDAAFQAASNAVQIFGGNGFNESFPVEKLLRDSKTLQIYGGTSEIQRLVIARELRKKYTMTSSQL
uniref:Ubiquitin-like domain-containing protein n=1 Tax=Globodera rostochiensis TaxID=31243 RepID=A0A914HIK4_GLORO